MKLQWYPHGATVLAIIWMAVVAVFIASLIITTLQSPQYWNVSRYYANGVAPDGWYNQREGISPNQIINGQLGLPMCDHGYLGPLHGLWNVSSNVTFPVTGWYNLRVANGTIVEVQLREECKP